MEKLDGQDSSKMQHNNTIASHIQREIANTVYLSSAYLPPIHYFSKIFHAEQIVIEQHCNYIKQTYRTRCNIAAANGVLCLSIPIDRESGSKTQTKDILIAHDTDWQKQHWKSIESAYNTSAFFEYYKDDFMPFYEKKWKYLFDYNTELLQMIMQLIDIDTKITFTQNYESQLTTGTDFRELIHPKKDSSLLDSKYTCPEYYQVFNDKMPFQPNLSIIDLLFNMGNESRIILKKSVTEK